jgi:hypothetical protein
LRRGEGHGVAVFVRLSYGCHHSIAPWDRNGADLLIRHGDVAQDEPGAQGPPEALPVHQTAPAAAAGGGDLGSEGAHAAAPGHAPHHEEGVAQLAPYRGRGRGALTRSASDGVGKLAGWALRVERLVSAMC